MTHLLRLLLLVGLLATGATSALAADPAHACTVEVAVSASLGQRARITIADCPTATAATGGSVAAILRQVATKREQVLVRAHEQLVKYSSFLALAAAGDYVLVIDTVSSDGKTHDEIAFHVGADPSLNLPSGGPLATAQVAAVSATPSAESPVPTAEPVGPATGSTGPSPLAPLLIGLGLGCLVAGPVLFLRRRRPR